MSVVSIPRETIDQIKSANALGLLVFLLNSVESDHSCETLRQRLSLSVTGTRSAIKELETLKLIERTRARGKQGKIEGWRWTTTAYLPSTMLSKNHTWQKPEVDNRDDGVDIKKLSVKKPDSVIENKSKEKNTKKRKQFLILWDLFFVEDPLNPSRKIKKFSAVGPQGKAYDAWCRINPSETEAETIIAKVKSELDRRVHQHASGEFAPNLPHVVRLIRDRRWEEFEESEVITKEFHF